MAKMKTRYYSQAVDSLDYERESDYMIHEDRSAIANLPQDAMFKQYPPRQFAVDGDIDDCITGVDKQIRGDMDAYRRNFAPKK